jgi:hypothetical protein
MASSCNPAGDDKPDDQTTTTLNYSSNDFPPLEFADQPQSRLMTIPRELRDMIYVYVYEHDSDTQKTATKSMDEEAEVCGPPMRISLQETAPPTKNAILPCRQLYFEMRKVQNSAYRACWTDNQFDFSYNWAIYSNFGPKPGSIQSDEDVQHIRHFSSSVDGHHLFDPVFELGRWRARVFPFVGKPLEPKDFEHNDYMFYSWRNVQEDVEGMVESILKDTREPADDDV